MPRKTEIAARPKVDLVTVARLRPLGQLLVLEGKAAVSPHPGKRTFRRPRAGSQPGKPA